MLIFNTFTSASKRALKQQRYGCNERDHLMLQLHNGDALQKRPPSRGKEGVVWSEDGLSAVEEAINEFLQLFGMGLQLFAKLEVGEIRELLHNAVNHSRREDAVGFVDGTLVG